MRLRLALAALSALARAEEAGTNGPNAAALYAPAFAQVAAWAAAHPDAAGYPARDAASPAAARAFAELRPALASLAAASSAVYCNWGTRFEDGPGATLPYLAPVRQTVHAALWATDYALSNNLPSFADDALEALRVSRNAGEDPLLISYLVQMAGERPALELLAAHLDRLSEAQVGALADRLAALPPGGDVGEAARMEKALFVDQMIGALLRAMREADTNLFEVLPDGAAPANEPDAGGASWLAKNLRLASVVDNGLHLWIGFETPQGESFTVAPGRPSHGIELLSASVARGEAVIARGDETALVRLQSREIKPFRLHFRLPAGAEGRPASTLAEVLAGLGALARAPDGKDPATPEGLLAMLQRTSTEYEEWLGALERLPPGDFRRWQEPFLQRSTVLTQSLLPAVAKVMEKERELLRSRERLAAAIAARLRQAESPGLRPRGSSPDAGMEPFRGKSPPYRPASAR